MKRLVYGVTIGLVGVLAVMAVKLPVTHEVSLFGDTGVVYGGLCFDDFQNELEPLRPLVISRGAPSLPSPAAEELRLDESPTLSLSGESASFKLEFMDERSDVCSYGETDFSGIGSSDDIGSSCLENVYGNMADSLICPEYESDACINGIHDNKRTGFVLLDAVMKRHPLWMEVLRIEREIETCRGRWQSYVDASGITEEDVLKCLGIAEQALGEAICGDLDENFEFPQYKDVLESRLNLVEASLTGEADARIQAKATELEADLEDRLYAEKARLNNEFDELRDRAVKENYLAIVNTQMKLQLLKLSDVQREVLKEELQHLNDEIEKELSAKQKALDDVYALYEAGETAQADRELMQFRKEQVGWVSSQLQQERERLSKEIEGFFTDTAPGNPDGFEAWQEEVSRRGRIELSCRRAQMSDEFKERESQFTVELDELVAGREQVLERIKTDVFHVVSNLSHDTDIPIEIIEDDLEHRMAESFDVDMTQDAIFIIRNYE